MTQHDEAQTGRRKDATAPDAPEALRNLALFIWDAGLAYRLSTDVDDESRRAVLLRRTIRALSAVIAEAQAVLDRVVLEASISGVTWREIGENTGLSAQAAHLKWTGNRGHVRGGMGGPKGVALARAYADELLGGGSDSPAATDSKPSPRDRTPPAPDMGR